MVNVFWVGVGGGGVGGVLQLFQNSPCFFKML